jgi:hypothetical protein
VVGVIEEFAVETHRILGGRQRAQQPGEVAARGRDTRVVCVEKQDAVRLEADQ